RIDDAGIVRAAGEQLTGHDRAGIEAERTTRDQIASPHRNEVRRARPRADEMHRHGPASVSVGLSHIVARPFFSPLSRGEAVVPEAKPPPCRSFPTRNRVDAGFGHSIT